VHFLVGDVVRRLLLRVLVGVLEFGRLRRRRCFDLLSLRGLLGLPSLLLVVVLLLHGLRISDVRVVLLLLVVLGLRLRLDLLVNGGSLLNGLGLIRAV